MLSKAYTRPSAVEPKNMLGVEPRASKDTVAILAGLQAAYPHAEQPEHAALHELLGATNERVIGRAVALLREGNAQQLGAPCWPLAVECRS